jgi:hypothetical protein
MCGWTNPQKEEAMSDVTTSLRAQEISERTQGRAAQAYAGVAVQAPQTVFPDDKVQLSSAAQQRIAEESGAAVADTTAGYQAAAGSAADDALSEMTTRLNRLMSVYGVTSSQTTLFGSKVVDVLRNEVKRLAGTVEPPTIETQVRQELNFIVRQMEVKMDLNQDHDSPNAVSVDLGLATLEYADASEPVGSLLAEPGSTGADAAGNPVNLSTVNSGLFFTETGNESASGGSAFDRFSGRLSTAAMQTAEEENKAAVLPDINQDGARNDSDRGAVMVVRGAPKQDRQAETGIAQFVADLAVPIPVRASEATPSRGQRRETTD